MRMLWGWGWLLLVGGLDFDRPLYTSQLGVEHIHDEGADGGGGDVGKLVQFLGTGDAVGKGDDVVVTGAETFDARQGHDFLVQAVAGGGNKSLFCVGVIAVVGSVVNQQAHMRGKVFEAGSQVVGLDAFDLLFGRVLEEIQQVKTGGQGAGTHGAALAVLVGMKGSILASAADVTNGAVRGNGEVIGSALDGLIVSGGSLVHGFSGGGLGGGGNGVVVKMEESFCFFHHVSMQVFQQVGRGDKVDDAGGVGGVGGVGGGVGGVGVGGVGGGGVGGGGVGGGHGIPLSALFGAYFFVLPCWQANRHNLQVLQGMPTALDNKTRCATFISPCTLCPYPIGVDSLVF